MQNSVTKLTRGMAVALILLACTPAVGLAAGPGEQTFALKIEHGQVAQEMRVIRVKQGDRVRLEWTSDETVTLHLHGYDIEKEIKPGAITTFSFKAYATGRFPINMHAAAGHAQGEATLVYLEVYPR